MGYFYFQGGIIIWSVAPTESSAATTYTGVVNLADLPVRAKASASSTKLGTLKVGTVVTVYTKNNKGWTTILYKGKKSYVNSTKILYPKKSTVSSATVMRAKASASSTSLGSIAKVLKG